MTAAEVAKLYGGRRIRPGQWMARCPAHDDSQPSLKIAEGSQGRILIHCFAGCDVEEVLRARGLSFHHLFPDTQLTPEERAAIMRDRNQREALAASQTRSRRNLTTTLWRWEALRDSLAIKLADQPEGREGDELARLFHSTLDHIRVIEADLEAAHG